MKRFLAIFLLAVLLISVLPFGVFAEEEITVLVNGEKLITDVPAQEMPVYDENGGYLGDRVMVPLRAIGEKLNCDVFWSEENEGITLYRKNQLTLMWIGKDYGFFMDGIGLSKHYFMDVPPTVIDNRTLVPVRATAELLGATVGWLEETNTVTIDYDLGEIEENTGTAEQCVIYNSLLKEEYDNYVGYFTNTLDTITGKIVLEDEREIKFELYPQFAPKSCERFITCAKDGFYDDTIFHRVIDGFVMQGGGFDRDGNEKNQGLFDYLDGEFVMNGHFNLLSHQRGILSFARTDDYNGATTQFFIVHQNASFLDGYYAGFGKVTEGLSIVDEICTAQTDENDIPLEPVMVKTVIID